MTAFYSSEPKRHNRPGIGPWYLKGSKEYETISFQMSHPNRSWQDDPIFRTGDLLIVLGYKVMSRPYGSVGWSVRALDKDLKEFKFYWSDETPFRSVWKR